MRRSVSALVVCLAALGCKKQAEPSGTAPSAAPSGLPAPVASGLPGDPTRVSQVVNPKGEPAYSGPTGGVRGTVTATGDAATTMDELLAKIPDSCAPAREAYRSLFREGLMRSLGDVLVAVTGYQGYVPEREPTVTVEARQCSFNTRTVALTYGQSLRVVSKDNEPYVPALLGAPQPVQMVAMPHGSGTDLYPPRPGRFMLSDSIKVFMLADVFVLKFATHAVTGLDGRYEITGIPAGEVKINALLPSTGAVAEKTITIEAGKTIEVNLEIPFDKSKLRPKDGAPAPSAAQGAPSAAPAASGTP